MEYDESSANEQHEAKHLFPEVLLVAQVEPNPTENPPCDEIKKQSTKFWRIVTADYKSISFKKVIEMAGLFIALAALYIYSRQLDTMSGQLKEMQSSGTQTAQMIVNAAHQASETHTLAEASVRQAKAAETQAKNSFISITATQNAMHLEQRAWVSVGAVTLDPPEAGKPINISVGWKNNGRTFAKNATPLTHHVLISDQVTSIDALAQVPGITEPAYRTIGVLAPGGEYKTVMKSNAPITELDKARLVGTWFTYIFGEIRYDDIFRQPHYTTFCVWRQGVVGEFLQCPFHNNAD